MQRRQLIQAGLVAATALHAAPRRIPVGIATNDFRDFTNAGLAKEFAAQKIKLIQLFFTQSDSNYWKYGGRSDLPGMTDERAREIAATYKASGISIHSLGVYTTLIHPDAAERKANLAYFERMFKVGAQMGVRMFLTEAGHYMPPGAAQRTPYDFQDDVWKLTVATIKELAAIAEANGATVLLEPFYISVMASAKRVRCLVEEVASKNIRINLDPANLIELNDLEEMFDQLAKYTVCVHAKDRKLHVGQGVAAGKGDIDYTKLVKLVAQRTPGAPLVIEYVNSKNYRPALEYLRDAMKKAGVAEA